MPQPTPTPLPSLRAMAHARSVAQVVALALLLFSLTALLPGVLPGGASPAQAAVVEAPDALVTFGEDIHVRPGERIESAVAFGGDILVEGTVTNSVVCFGGDVDLRPGSHVGSGLGKDDAAVVVFGGDLRQAPGAAVAGTVVNGSNFNWDWAGDLGGVFTAVTPLAGGAGFRWGVGLVIWALVGLLAVAVIPRQLRAVQNRLETRPAVYLGWGALEALVVFPLLTLLMIVTIVGILVAVPWAIFVVPLMFLVGYLAAAGLVGAKLLEALGGHDDLLLATIVGLIAFKVIGMVPVLGTLLLILVWLAGLGATVAAIWGWQRGRSSGPHPASPGESPGQAPSAAAAGAGTGAEVQGPGTGSAGQDSPAAAGSRGDGETTTA